MEQCIFCKIVAKELPSYLVYEDNEYLGFLDIFPRVHGHTLLIPKSHYRWTYDVADFGGYWERAKKIGMAMQNALKVDFVSFMTYGMDVHHAHIHIMPRNEEGNTIVPEQKKYSEEEMKTVAEIIRSSLK